jgi:hypothetical protein
VDLARVAEGNVAVDLAVNEENWNFRGGDGVLGRDLLHVQVMFPADVEESEFDDRAEEGSTKPGAEVKGLSHAVVGDLAKAGEGRFGGDGAEAGLDGERLQKLSGTHGFTESEDAVRMILCGEEVEPLVNVVAFEETVGGEVASAGAVGARIGEENAEAMSEEEFCVSGHAEAIVAEAVKEDDGVAVAAMGMDRPGTEGDGVWGADGNIFQGGIELGGDLAHCGFFF